MALNRDHPTHLPEPAGPSPRVSSINSNSSQTRSISHGVESPSPGNPRVLLGHDEKPVRHKRSHTVSSFSYFIGHRPKIDDLSIFEDGGDPAYIQKFLDDTLRIKKKRYRRPLCQHVFRILWIVLLLCLLYFVVVGFPLWLGLIRVLWRFFNESTAFAYGALIFLFFGAFMSWLPLVFGRFESKTDDVESRDASEVAVIIPAYKAAAVLPATIEHCLKIFKPKQIFIVANGSSQTPLDNAAEVCAKYGVNHSWVGIGSKITAEFVGVALAKDFRYIMLIDDDVHLPPNLPIVTKRLTGKTACIGYTITSTGANGAKGTLIQQVQDMEYKLAGLARTFCGRYGSSVFPHGAISLWDRQVLEDLFYAHPGFTISEDWYFGHVCRSSGHRIQFCSQIFVETETPPCLFIPQKATRGGYGEMTLWKQRFYRWNYFYLYRLRDDIYYMFLAWRLGRYEFVTKIYIFFEIYDVLSYALRIFVLPIILVASPKVTLIYTAALLGVYMVSFIAFNLYHLHRKKAMVAWKVLPVYFGVKLMLMIVNTISVYYALYQYGKFFSVRRPMVTENHDALVAARTCLDHVREERRQAETAAQLRATKSVEVLPLSLESPGMTPRDSRRAALSEETIVRSDEAVVPLAVGPDSASQTMAEVEPGIGPQGSSESMDLKMVKPESLC